MQRGDIYWVPFGEPKPVVNKDTGEPELDESGNPILRSKPRPCIIVSRDNLNEGNYVLVVPTTSQKLEERTRFPNCVRFSRGQYGLPKDCVAQAESLTYLDKKLIDWRNGKIGRVDAAGMAKLVRAIRWVVRCPDLP